ncbi:MAG: GAF domain-containing protein [Paraprevotella sp.]|nr:GAF domain-containing protein [Paraprevotella sp.]
MEIQFGSDRNRNKEDHYKHFLIQYAALIKDEKDEISVMANTTAALKEAFGFFWVGFYRTVSENKLQLGPFQGDVACFRILKGRGVCGTAWDKACTLIVPDVEAFPGHIACSSASRSEIVIPLMYGNEIKGVLDIDSDHKDAFDETDRRGLEAIVRCMLRTLYAANV